MRRRPAADHAVRPGGVAWPARCMYCGVSDGIYLEVGGTSTNIGRDPRRPADHEVRAGRWPPTPISARSTCACMGMAGGSMVRCAAATRRCRPAQRAHRRAALRRFPRPGAFATRAIEMFQPKARRPADYVAIRGADGKRSPDHHLRGQCAGLGQARQACLRQPRGGAPCDGAAGGALGLSVEDTAAPHPGRGDRQDHAAVEQLIAEYGLDPRPDLLVGDGGGAGALIPFAAERLGLRVS